MAIPAPVSLGKQIGSRIYVHRSAYSLLPPHLGEIAASALATCPEANARANVLKIDESGRIVSALHYPDFFSAAFPELRESWRIDMVDGHVSYRSYADSLNPPILHRKELLLPSDHPEQSRFAELTAQAEVLGLFVDSHLIGFRQAWEARIVRAGYLLVDHQLLPHGNAIEPDYGNEAQDSEVQRHRTALTRSNLSAPLQSLMRHGLLSVERSYFDYGCGRGDDLRHLQLNGYKATGWDPYYVPDGSRTPAEIVNLGFVINVIEDIDERTAALQGAFGLAKSLLVVSAMLYSSTPPPGRPFRDGYRTQRNTFQKYFTQSELKEFVEEVLHTEAIPVSPGIVYVFADKSAEQRFLFSRQRGQPRVSRCPAVYARRQLRDACPRPSRVERLIQQHRNQLDALWDTCLELGREPLVEEFYLAAEVCEAFGSWKRALRIVFAINNSTDFSHANSRRRDDLIVFLALRLFGKRKSYRQLETGLQREIKAHFGDYATAQALAQQALAEIAVPNLLDVASQAASEQGLGYYMSNDYLQLSTKLVPRLPALLRIYVGCGAILYGDLDGVDLLKIHLSSGKLSLMKFDDFNGKALPLMKERIKVKLRSQEIDFFVYGEDSVPCPPLYYKSRYLNEESPGFAEQLAFDEALAQLDLFDPGSYGPNAADLYHILAQRRLEVCNFSILPAQAIPELDESCGPHFTYRDLIECGETWRRTRVDNRPMLPESYNALHALATNLLAPIIDYFGMIKLTYGFAGPLLTVHINSRIAPALDQHAASELNSRGKLICPRKGAAVDFIVDDEDMLNVAKWIVEEVPFDRMYIYGPARPIHLSYGPEHSRQVTVMSLGAKGLYPKTMKLNAFRRFQWNY